MDPVRVPGILSWVSNAPHPEEDRNKNEYLSSEGGTSLVKGARVESDDWVATETEPDENFWHWKWSSKMNVVSPSNQGVRRTSRGTNWTVAHTSVGAQEDRVTVTPTGPCPTPTEPAYNRMRGVGAAESRSRGARGRRPTTNVPKARRDHNETEISFRITSSHSFWIPPLLRMCVVIIVTVVVTSKGRGRVTVEHTGPLSCSKLRSRFIVVYGVCLISLP